MAHAAPGDRLSVANGNITPGQHFESRREEPRKLSDCSASFTGSASNWNAGFYTELVKAGPRTRRRWLWRSAAAAALDGEAGILL
jgi:hypothetical protein